MKFQVEDLRISDGYWYLATPYSKYIDGLHHAAMDACRVAGELLIRGINCYSPIAHSHHIAIYSMIDPLDQALWLPAGKPLFDGARGLIVADMPGWRESFGIGEEIKWCINAKKPRWLLAPRDMEVQALP